METTILVKGPRAGLIDRNHNETIVKGLRYATPVNHNETIVKGLRSVRVVNQDRKSTRLNSSHT